jgi:tetratricopeptide (TPR) repeat protein
MTLHGGSAMSTTLNLTDRLLGMARNFQALGRQHDALRILDRITGMRELGGPAAEEAQARLAELLLARRQYQKARRHLSAALVHQPRSARYHYLMGVALAADPQCDPQRALEHFRTSLDVDPVQPECLGELGQLALQMGRPDEALACLRQAVELAPENPVAVGNLATALQECDLNHEARQVLLAARFRNAKDPRFEKLWNDFHFMQVLDQQSLAARTKLPGDALEDGPRILPFLRPVGGKPPAGSRSKRVRRDGASSNRGPHTHQPSWSDRRHA